jgi:RNA polymerase sigma factor (TIGR02999 family)
MNTDISLTQRLRHYLGGDEDFAETVLREVLPKLRQIASRQVGREKRGSPLSATELIHEVWLRNLHQGGWQIRDREHFYSIASYAMRQTLIDFARERSAQKRGSGERTLHFADLPDGDDPFAESHEQIVLFDIAMQQMEQKDSLTARVADLHYFAGFSLDETAEITGLSPRQVRHRWGKAQSFLRRCLPRSV